MSVYTDNAVLKRNKSVYTNWV